jgi:hypothetical protein
MDETVARPVRSGRGPVSAANATKRRSPVHRDA